MENKRILEIIRILLQQQGYITIREIAALLNVSNKTIRNDLALTEGYLDEYHLSLHKKTGTGIRIEGKESRKCRMDVEEKRASGCTWTGGIVVRS